MFDYFAKVRDYFVKARNRARRQIVKARNRARRKRSAWNLLSFAVGLLVTGLLWWLLCEVVWRLHVVWFPEHGPRKGDFWAEGISFWPFVSSFLMVVPLFLPALSGGMLIANCMLRLIPFVRRVLDKEAQEDPGTDYRSAQRGLLWATAIIAILTVPLAVLGAYTLQRLH